MNGLKIRVISTKIYLKISKSDRVLKLDSASVRGTVRENRPKPPNDPSLSAGKQQNEMVGTYNLMKVFETGQYGAGNG